MSAEREAARIAQRRAADPARSVWVAANAGSGKTTVLTERVARLLLEGARPSAILCLTFTKAAAAEMRARLFRLLGAWAMQPEADLRATLERLTGAPFAGDLAPARRLFAAALETPGGLRIETIHAFCDGVLRRFPLEAGAPPGFRTMEEGEKNQEIAALLDRMAAEGGRARKALEAVAALASEAAIADLAAEIARAPGRYPLPFAPEAISAAFGVPHPPDPATARRAAFAALDLAALARAIVGWEQGTAKEAERAGALAAAREEAPEALAAALVAVLLTAKGAPLAKLSTKSSLAAEPDLDALAARLAETAQLIADAEKAVAAADRAIRLHGFAAEFLPRWEARKAALGALDFGDLIGRTRALLTGSEAAAWALWRLDGGIDHILIDEAQDTSPEQWEVIGAIADELRAGEGARAGRTVFVVGDEKQSIYSFQGADADTFAGMRARWAAGVDDVPILHSFRSAPAILKAVDAVFAGEGARGLTRAGAPTEHHAFFDDRAGRVELWPLTPPDPTAEEPEPWAPVDLPAKRDPRVKLAEAVAARIAVMIGRERLPGGGRLVRAGDVIVLLRNRAPMMGPLVAGLKKAGVPVAGADRLALTEELAVRDLFALARAALSPWDDLSLACVLRSPLCAVTEDGLFALAHGRKGSLRRALMDAEARWPAEAALIRAAEGWAAGFGPFDFFSHALGPMAGGGPTGRARLLGRLGRAAEDPLDELLARALAFEAEHPPSLEGFLAWLASGEAEANRRADESAGEVRVMTAHGAKGLQAPVVILADTTRKPDSRADPTADLEGLGIWRGAAGEAPGLLARLREEEKARQAEEERRLLYVGMTRAEDWLIVAGAGEDEPKAIDGTWYDLVRTGFAALPMAPGPEGALVWEDAGAAKTGEAEAPAAEAEAPSLAPLPPEPAAPRRVAAGALLPHAAFGGAGLGAERAKLRGTAVHLALEEGIEAPEALLRRVPGLAAAGFDDAALGAMVAEAKRARALPEAAAFFGEGSRAEAPVSARLGGLRVSGRIDRLLIAPDRVAILDFKTDAAPPPGSESAPPPYLAQLAAYRAALAGLYPGRRIEAWLLWTAAPRLDRLPEAALDAALAAGLGAVPGAATAVTASS